MARWKSRMEVNPQSPVASGVCDRCDKIYPLHKLHWQHQWIGTELINLRLRVCSTCMDRPAEFLRNIKLPVDPVPVKDPRPPRFSIPVS